MNKEFLSTLTILYAEDDEAINQEMSSQLSKVFKKVISTKDGVEAFEEFKKNKNEINLVLSDINMPKMNGLELLKEIKNTGYDIPIVFITAHTEESFLIEALKLKVNDYLTKPTGIVDIVTKIEKISLKKQAEQNIKNEQNETKEYFELINKVAIVYIFNHEKKLIYTNDFLNDLLANENEDSLLGNEYTSLFHPDISKDILNKQWEDLQNNIKWQGKIKYITNHNTAFYANATIMPTQDESNPKHKKYISVNFLTTKEENERRAYKKQLIYNMQEAKRIFRVAQEKINSLTKELKRYEAYDEKEKVFKRLKESSQENFMKLQKSEEKLKRIKTQYEKLTLGINSKINNVSMAIKDMKDETEKNTKKIYKLRTDLKLREQFITKINLEIEEKKAKVYDLEDVLNFRTKEKEERS